MVQPGEMTPVLVCLMTLVLVSQGVDVTVNFEDANDCTSSYTGPLRIGPEDVVYANVQGRQNNFGSPLECVMKFVAQDKRQGLRLFTKHFKIDDCGVTLEIYDQNVRLQNPKWIFDCNTPSNEVYVLEGGEMTLRMAKVSTAAYFYMFNMQITTNDSPRMEHPQDIFRPSNRNTLTEGAMIGISISCVVAGGILIVIIVFLVVKVRRRRRHRQETQTKGPPLKEQY